MKKYDYAKAQKLILKNQKKLATASLGMQEDWSWTAETVFDDGKFTAVLSGEPTIGGIKGSAWATPTLELKFKDGTTKHLECFVGKTSKEKPAFMGEGIFSTPNQDEVPELTKSS
jgi:hypothetical protein